MKYNVDVMFGKPEFSTNLGLERVRALMKWVERDTTKECVCMCVTARKMTSDHVLHGNNVCILF